MLAVALLFLCGCLFDQGAGGVLCGINRGGFVYARLPSRLRDVFRINVKTNEIVVPHNLDY